jgi:hypothetical protein
MAKINVVSISPDGKTKYTNTIDDSELDVMKAKAESKGFTFQIAQPLSAAEGAAALANTAQETSPMQSAIGGLTQGLSLGTADFFGSDTESIRLRQEAEHPYIYGGTKFLGSLVPDIGLAGIGALGGGLIGGPPGALAGGAALAAAGGLIESYASKPTPPEGKGAPSLGDIGMGVISGLTQGVGAKAAPIARGAYRAARDKLGSGIIQGTTEVAENVAAEAAKKINANNALISKIKSNIKFKKGEELMNMSIDDIYAELDELWDVADAITTKKDLEAAVKAAGGTSTKTLGFLNEILTEQYKDAATKAAKSLTTAGMGAAGAAVPMAVPDTDLSKSDIEALNKRAIAQAYYDMQRSKMGSAKQ